MLVGFVQLRFYCLCYARNENSLYKHTNVGIFQLSKSLIDKKSIKLLPTYYLALYQYRIFNLCDIIRINNY